MTVETYRNYPLELPHDDGEDNFEYYPLVVDDRLDFAERFRRQGRVVYVLPSWFGTHEGPATLSLNQVNSINRTFWWRDAEPINLSYYQTMGAPHGYWKWRIYCEPKGLAGALYEIDNPASSSGAGASIMAEGLCTKGGVLTDLPIPFSAPSAAWQYTGGLQLGYTTDGGTTIIWCNPVWN